jgi:heme exporter protein B
MPASSPCCRWRPGRAPERLAAVAPGIAWLALALAALLSLERLFERDYEDGALDLLALGPAPLEPWPCAKCLAQWLAAGAPLALAAPIAALALGAPQGHAAAGPRAPWPAAWPSRSWAGWARPWPGQQARRPAGGGDRPAAVRSAGDLRGRGAGRLFAAGLPWTGGLLLLLAAYPAAAAVALGPIAMAAACRNALGGRGGPMGGQGGQHWGPQGGPMGGAQGGPPPR